MRTRCQTREIVYVRQVTGAFYDIIKRAAGVFQDLTDVRRSKPCFFFDAARNDRTRFQIQRSLPADKSPYSGRQRGSQRIADHQVPTGTVPNRSLPSWSGLTDLAARE